jgi:hypothetical protein
MRGPTLLCIASLALACGSRPPLRSAGAVAHPAAQDDACFGGEAEVITTDVGARSPYFDGGTAITLMVAGRNLLWDASQGPDLMDLGTHKRGHAGFGFRAFFKGADDRDAYGVSAERYDEGENNTDLVAVDLKTGKKRTVVVGKGDQVGLSPVSNVALDGEHVYFIRPRAYGRSAEQSGFFRVRKQGAGEGGVERIGAEPQDGRLPFLIADGYAYWSRGRGGGDGEGEGPALWRRTLVPGSPEQRLVSTKDHHVPLFVHHGRLFYVDSPGLFSIPVDGSSKPTLHAASQVRQSSVVADRTCVYFTSERGIERVRIGRDGATPELIVDEYSYHGGPIVTDGQRLYWIDRFHDRILGMGRSAASLPERPALVAKTIDAKDLPADIASSESKLLVGDGWGCAKVFGWNQPHWQCWATPAGTKRGPVTVKARFVPGLSPGAEPAVATDRLCFLDGEKGKCWAWTDLLHGKPADFLEVQAWQGRLGQWLVGGDFSCLLHYVGAERMLACSGDNRFGQLAGKDQPIALERWTGALGTWHGCVSNTQGRDIECWGRGDAGQLGRVPDTTCVVDGRKIPCDERLGKTDFNLQAQVLFAGDMFTCVVLGYPRELRCWGGSRDGWFGDEPCSPELRQAWPVPRGAVAAAKATCSALPARVLEPGSTIGAITVGPRGACVVEDDRPHCLGAIPTPSAAVDNIAVSNGIQANACGIDGERVVCWGERYSPPDQLGLLVPVSFEATTPTSAVLDAPPPGGTAWTKDHQINHGCGSVPLPLPRCDAKAVGEPWSSLAGKVESLRDQRVSVRDRLVIGPLGDASFDGLCGDNRRAPPESTRGHAGKRRPGIGPVGCHPQRRPIVLGTGLSPLRFWDNSGKLACAGDESRLCCGAPAFGQTVIATGVLSGSAYHGWGLKDAVLCEPRSP